MPVYWLNDNDVRFPPLEYAMPDGLLAIGGDLSVKRLLGAYKCGIFPWYNATEPIMWWSPDPRLVLFPDKLHVAKSMRTYFNNNTFQLSYNHAFEEVMTACGEISRKNQDGTWIHQDLVDAYVRLHKAGFAHSVEVWKNSRLVGGLYGIAIGKVFFGESMFAHLPNASKFGFISLVKKLAQLNFKLIDCQQETPHLKSLGAELLDRNVFVQILQENDKKFSHEKLKLD
ncbi:MAG TPA: leucyl/phenylalanyl-tRNA--protein transferase [Saprospiraceae bacterium]|jgi:leucyl/phenylalanyl-tRNA--protein transferase|nr:leucyl/phenylalanyl-tRNA--protein transferase [Saprospiraceae bacterium]MCC6688623.1 leucyl/phenylalanyl-tRNA--protein transferase [Saprospiraceae bacterium]HMV24305.1 leucyl/phenylalanyl-tRNA--protein transferase [Saprospiraceae bacterium]HMW74617.1 leucyl/phenylalanyl-tRNA--protein transferase [Saprospiraceae bacterium]HMX82874.1 leucyl/phenylalanyl-tRNA--protein transferase [Saprospiraceae bacterium]